MSRILEPSAEQTLIDPLSAVTRVERRWLLAIAVLLLAITFGDLVPRKIDALGIEFSPGAVRSLVLLIIAIELYYLITFVIYASADRALWLHRVNSLREQIKKAVRSDEGKTERAAEAREKGMLLEAAEAAALGHPSAANLRYRREIVRSFFPDVEDDSRIHNDLYELLTLAGWPVTSSVPLYSRLRRYGVRLFVDVHVPWIVAATTVILAAAKLII